MAFLEKSNWVVLVVAVPTLLVYAVLIVPQVLASPVEDITWVLPMVVAIVGFVVANILGNIVAAASNPSEADREDERDREIDRYGERIGNWVIAAGGVAALVLAMAMAHQFWIANALFLGGIAAVDRQLRREDRRVPRVVPAMVKPTRVTNSIRTLRFAARRDDAGGARRPGRRHPADRHRHRAGPLLADSWRWPSRSPRVFRRAPRRRLPVPGRRRAARMTHRSLARHVPGHTITRRPERSHTMPARSTSEPSLPPRWFIRSFWAGQRAVYAVSGGRVGLRAATDDHQGMMRLHTVGRRSGEPRTAILAFFEDGTDLVTMAMNGWADPEPAWWLNLQANPDTVVDLPSGRRAVRARAAGPDERPRLWARWAEYDEGLDAYAARRSRETAVVILSPRADAATG